MKRKVKITKDLSFGYAIRSFQGYLEGTHKALHTISNYRFDLLSFQRFLETAYSKGAFKLENITSKDLDAFHDHLKVSGLKVNSRRRKLMTVRRFLSYLAQRKKINMDLGRTLLTPEKVERIPLSFSSEQVIPQIRALSGSTLIEKRNRLLLWTLAETGCLVSELSRVRFENFTMAGGSAFLEITGKSERKLPISRELFEEMSDLRPSSGLNSAVFLGFNRNGSLGTPITPRGVELLVKAYASKIGLKKATPRLFRHSAALQWFKDGHSNQAIQIRLGLKTQYAFRAYDLLFKSSV